ncbi:MAG: YhgE/Pip family protein [Clostridia bacterium]
MEIKLKNSKTFKIIIFIVVALIPLIYSFFYLKSYWNPYGNLSDMRIAVVNSDKGKDDKNQGNEFVQSLKDSDTFKIEEVNKEEADEGMKKGNYYATIQIPENFTECLESGATTDKQIAEVTYNPNQATNYLGTQIINSAIKTIQLNLQSKIDKEVIANLSSKLNEVPESLQEISDGAGEILDGSESLNSGIEQLNEGTEKLSSSYSEFNDGVESAYTGSKSLEDGISQVSGGINSLKDGGKTLDSAISQINQGANQLSEQGSNGIADLASGANDLNEGAKTLDEGMQAYVPGTNGLASGAKDYIEGSNKLLTSVEGYFSKVNELGSNAGKLITNLQAIAQKYPDDAQLQALVQSASDLTKGFSGLQQYEAGINKGKSELQSNDTKIKSGADQLLAVGNKLQTGADSLYKGTQSLVSGTSDLGKITTGIQSLKDALAQVKSGTTTLNQGIDTLSNGTGTLSAGSHSLTTGLAKLDSSSETIDNALDTLNNGTQTAYDGSNQLVSGVQTFKVSIDEGLDNTKEQLRALDGIEDFGAEPVKLNTEAYGEVSSYGIAFTPLFLCIGLWVGALMAYVVLYYDHDERFGILGINNKHRIVQNLIYLGIGAVEGLITSILLKVGLGFEVQNIALYYGTSILLGIAFMSIIQFLIKNFGDIGKFLALIILVLQLAASGGTFPVETIDKGFQAISPYLPMTYAIKLLREILVPTTQNFKAGYIAVLVGIILVTGAITFIVDILKRKNGSYDTQKAK